MRKIQFKSNKSSIRFNTMIAMCYTKAIDPKMRITQIEPTRVGRDLVD